MAEETGTSTVPIKEEAKVTDRQPVFAITHYNAEGVSFNEYSKYSDPLRKRLNADLCKLEEKYSESKAGSLEYERYIVYRTLLIEVFKADLAALRGTYHTKAM